MATHVAELLRLMAMTGASLLWVPQALGLALPVEVVRACQETTTDIRLVEVHDRLHLIAHAASMEPFGLLLIRGLGHLTDNDLRWLDQQRSRLQVSASLIFELSESDRIRLIRLAPHLWDMLGQLVLEPDPGDLLPLGLATQIAVAGVLPLDLEADRITDELVQRRTAHWSSRPLTRKGRGQAHG